MDIGSILIYASLLVGLFSLVGLIEGIRKERKRDIRNARQGIVLISLLVTIASMILFYYFLTRDFNVLYVAMYSDRYLSTFYTISAFWAGSQGSMLLWAWILSLFMVGIVLKDRNDKLTNLALVFLLSVEIFFLLLLSSVLDPFERLEFMPMDGQGLNPLLRDPGMAFHPVTLFIGYAGLTIPFAYALAGVILEEDIWVFRIRKWTLFSWAFLTLGIAFGAEWAYTTLGWGGFWGWDPVENSSLLPWLTATAFLHSVMIQEAKKGMKLWNILLAFATFEFVIFGTFLTRSGVISSVHSFGQSGVGPVFGVYMILILLMTVLIIYKKYDTIRSRDVIESMLSRESTFLLNNLVLVVAALTIFWGTIFPILSEAVEGYKITVGPPFYNLIEIPLGVALVVLMGLCVIVGWRRFDPKKFMNQVKYPGVATVVVGIVSFIAGFGIPATIGLAILAFVLSTHVRQYVIDYREFAEKANPRRANPIKVVLKKRRRYGGYTVHLGVFLIFLGTIGGWMYDSTHEVSLNPGQAITLKDYSFVYKDAGFSEDKVKRTWMVQIDVYKNGEFVGTSYPKIEQYIRTGQDIVKVSIISTLSKDVYIILEGLSNGVAYLKIKFLPLMWMIWAGVSLMMVGVVIALFPRRMIREIVE